MKKLIIFAGLFGLLSGDMAEASIFDSLKTSVNKSVLKAYLKGVTKYLNTINSLITSSQSAVNQLIAAITTTHGVTDANALNLIQQIATAVNNTVTFITQLQTNATQLTTLNSNVTEIDRQIAALQVVASSTDATAAANAQQQITTLQQQRTQTLTNITNIENGFASATNTLITNINSINAQNLQLTQLSSTLPDANQQSLTNNCVSQITSGTNQLMILGLCNVIKIELDNLNAKCNSGSITTSKNAKSAAKTALNAPYTQIKAYLSGTTLMKLKTHHYFVTGSR